MHTALAECEWSTCFLLIHTPLYLCEQEVNVVAAFVSTLKDGLTLVKEQDGVVDLGLSKDKLEVISSTHTAQ